MKDDRESGAIIVEASIYFPITIGIVMVIIYLGLFKIQESYFFFQVERVASMCTREIAYPGYEEFSQENLLEDSAIDFSWENGPTEKQVKNYYDAYGGCLTKIYRLGMSSKNLERLSGYQKALEKTSALFSMGTTKASVRMENNALSKTIYAEIQYKIPTPGILRYLGVKDSLTLYAAACQPVMNSTDFVRNIDLAWDMGNFLLKKLGLDGKANEFIQKFNRVKEIIF